jgi:hypothetical protein
MATLNGNTINGTYKGLIKFIDNGQATTSLKELTDGFGNTLGIHLDATGNFEAEGNVTVDGVIDSTGGNKIAFFFANQAAFPDATTYHGAIAHSHADGKMYFAHGGAWVELGLASDIPDLTALQNQVDNITTKTAGTGITDTSDTFDIDSDQRGNITQMGHDTSNYISVDGDGIDFYANGTEEMHLANDGTLHVDGDVVAFSTTTASDRRLKEDIENIDNALDKIGRINGVTYKWKGKDSTSAGVIAQEVREVLPEAVSEVYSFDRGEHLSVNYNAVIGLLIESVKELKEEINQLKQ